MKALHAWVCCAALVTLGCEQDETRPNFEYAPDMVSSEAVESFTKMMVPPEGTLARGVTPVRYAPGYEEAVRAGKELMNPLRGTPEELARGELAFNRYCAPCHSATGQGGGLVTVRFTNPPSLLAKHAQDLPDGQLFHIITHGQGVMPAHGQQVEPNDRWKIVHWVRRMQRNVKLTQKATP